ncbi:MAG: penicillin-binding protein 1B [Gammaproteobacteria bacterium RBG_16_57_12]|nr:MAG: penicillin-binding protein 1B [Gammaproteobacteria bacterium RBG_16_57_12]
MSRTSRRNTFSSGRWRARLKWLTLLLITAAIALTAYVYYLDYIIREKFDGKRWELPARVYARPLELYPSKIISMPQLLQELTQLDYQPGNDGSRPGTYIHRDAGIEITTRPFAFWDGQETAQHLRVTLADGQVQTIADRITGQSRTLVRLDPVLIASIYPAHQEDRILLQLAQVPDTLRETLLAVEDRHFMSHRGLDIQAILRALWVNVRSGHIVQGGSTLTQQLVKNFYLSDERTLWRKFNEAIMALLLERRYEKEDILEAYCNEIYLGQDGRRAIHGFALASQFYFLRPLQELTLPQYALLVGIVQGPSYYDPRRYPERALQQRNQVLDILYTQGAINKAQRDEATQAPLGVSEKRPSGVTPYPAFLDLVRTQLLRDYPPEDLQGEGLRIFTTLDPLVQTAVEQSISRWVPELEAQRNLPDGQLEAAAIVTSIGNAEVAAVVGGRDVHYAGYNHALNISRQIGSLIKPAVYLTALAQPQYTLATLVEDAPVRLVNELGTPWTPENYDQQVHGQLPLFQALAQSYNLATINLGMQLGLEPIIKTVHSLGVEKTLAAYPSLLLGAVELSPLEVTQMYQTIGDNGFYTPLRAIRAVTTHDNQLLQRYPLQTEQRVAPEAVFLLNAALQQALQEGTGRDEYLRTLQGMALAGKTGTTNDLRDSWYAGFGGDYLGVVWLGADDNRSIGHTGASGALRIWGGFMTAIEKSGLVQDPPEGVEMELIDWDTGLLADGQCIGAARLPFLQGSGPGEYAPCAGSGVSRALNGVMKWFKENRP